MITTIKAIADAKEIFSLMAVTKELLSWSTSDPKAYKTPKVETTTSFAAKPVCSATLIFQSNPSGSKIGSENFPIEPK